jgi:hypothetical protein
MRIRDHPGTAAAILLGGTLVLHAMLGIGGGWPSAAKPPGKAGSALPAEGSGARLALQWCREHVTIIHDVYWAAACTVQAEAEQARRAACLQAQGLAAASTSSPCETALAPLDDSPDCTLPDARASTLNSARAAAEQQCLVDATATERTSLMR